MSPVSAGMRAFLQVAGDFKRISSLAVKGVMTAPTVYAAMKLAPPPSNTITIVTTALQLLSLVWVFQFWFSLKERSLRIKMRVAAAAFLVLSVASFVLIQQFTVPVGHSPEKVVIGYEVKPAVQVLLNPTFGPLDALRSWEYDPDRVWTARSLATMRITIALVWVSTFVALTAYLGIFVILQRRR